MRLDFLDLLPTNLKDVKSVLQASSIKVIQNGQLLFVRRDNHFSADFVRDPVFARKTRPSSDCLRVPSVP